MADIEKLTEELKKTKEALLQLIAKDENNFDTPIVQAHPDCLKILDTEGRILFMNYNGMCQMEIKDFSEIRYKHWWEFWGKENEKIIKSAVDKALKGETVKFTAECQTALGNVRVWDVLVSPLGNPTKQILSVSKII